MYAQIEKSKENKSRVVANSVAQKKSEERQGFGFVDNRPEAIEQRKIELIMNRNQEGKVKNRTLNQYVVQAFSTIQRDRYTYGGPIVTPHIHCYSDGCHLKIAGGSRINLVQDNFKRPRSIHEAFEWVRETYAESDLRRTNLLVALRNSVRNFPVRENYVPFGA